MTQEERWNVRYQEVVEFIETGMEEVVASVHVSV